MLNTQWTIGLVIGLFAKSCIYPGWSSASELACSFALVGFLSWYQARSRPQSVTALERKALEDIQRLEHEVKDLTSQLGAFKMKLGFRNAG